MCDARLSAGNLLADWRGGSRPDHRPLHDFVGFADFLVVARDDAGAVVCDARGMAMYEPVDTKSARSAKR